MALPATSGYAALLRRAGRKSTLLRARAAASASRARSALEGRSLPVWAIGVGVALLTWNLSFGIPAVGLDPSWVGGLYMAVHDGRDFGTEIVFSYGPLGFLSWPDLWYSDLAALAFLYGAAVYLAFSCTLIWVLGRSLGKLGAAVVAFVFLATASSLEQIPIVLAVAWALAAMREERPPFAINLLIVGGASLSAVEALVKLSLGPPIFLVCAIALFGVRASRRQWAAFLCLAVAELTALWLLTGQPLGALVDYAVNGEQILSGYNEAMGLKTAPGWEAPVMVAVAVAVAVGSAFGRYRDSRARWCGVGLVSLTSFVIFKYGIVRYEPNHLAIAFSTALALWLVIPWARRGMAVLLVGAAVIGFVSIHAYPAPARFDAIANLSRLGDQVEVLVDSGRRREMVAEARTALRADYGLDDATLARLRGKRVAIDPWEIGVAWAYELDWSPLPVFQDYAAFTADLDRLNTEKVEDPDGPQVILRENPEGVDPLTGTRSFEGRHPAWDPPAQNLATVCNFAPVLTAKNWQVLERVKDRCGEPELIASEEGGPGVVVAVPPAGPGEIVFVRIHGVAVGGLEELRSLLWRPRFRFLSLNGGTIEYRLVPGTAMDGLMVSRAPGLDSPGLFAQIPAVEDMSLEGVKDGIRYDFYRVKVRRPLPLGSGR